MLTMTPNSQAPEQLRISDGQYLDVQGQPWLTVQGEGPLTGRPAVFVRLAGCTLKCASCDTDYTSNRTTWGVSNLVEKVVDLVQVPNVVKPNVRRIVVVTGGEPFRQNISELVKKLTWEYNVTVQVETNGREKPQGGWFDLSTWNPLLHVVVSPKLDVCEEIWRLAGTAKYVLRAGRIDAVDGLPTGALGYASPPARPPKGWPGRVYVQPEDDQDERINRANAEACVKSALDFGYTVSVQTHKLLQVP